MCGIAGIMTFDGSAVSRESLKKMTDIIAHRGPDGEGHWLNDSESTGLGHRRLSIIDLSDNGRQPMHYADERYTVTFNGEIYNYTELRDTLALQGYTFRSQSDTEVLLALYSQKKEACLQDLDGMFAFAIWDEQEQTLFCARDRFGEKPFFYYKDNGRFIFASEMKAIWAYGIDRELENSMFCNYLLHPSMLVNPNNPEQTFYKNIHRLPNASYITVNKKGDLQKRSYWTLPVHTNHEITVEKAAETFLEMMSTSISRRLRSDVPVGSSLSGGLDSSSIVCLTDSLFGSGMVKYKTFSARFRQFEKDESVYMDQVIAHCRHVEAIAVYPDESNLVDEFEKLCFHQEEPSFTLSNFASWSIFKKVKQEGITVLLDGQGADEVLAGYPYYFPTYFEELYRSGQSARLKAELKGYEQIYQSPPAFSGHYSSSRAQLSHRMKVAMKPYYHRYSSLIKSIKQPAELMLTKSFMHDAGPLASPHEHAFSTLNERLAFDTTHYPLSNLLKNVDRNAMAFSVELRLPFLFHPMVEFLQSLPPHFKISDGWTKFIQRKTFEPYMPSSITWRKDKIGYEAPQAKWLENPVVKERIEHSIRVLEKNNILNPKRNKAHDHKVAILHAANLFEKQHLLS